MLSGLLFTRVSSLRLQLQTTRSSSWDKCVQIPLKTVQTQKYRKVSNNIKITNRSVSCSPVLVLEGWILDMSHFVQANSLCRSEGRGKHPMKSCSSQCLIVIKVSVKDGDWEKSRALAPSPITQRVRHCECWWRDRALVEETRSYAAIQVGPYRSVRLGSTQLGSITQSQHYSHTHSHIHAHTLQLSPRVTQAYQNALMMSPTITKRHIHSPKHADIQPL